MNCSNIRSGKACWCKCGMQWKWVQIARSVFIRQGFLWSVGLRAGGMFGHDAGGDDSRSRELHDYLLGVQDSDPYFDGQAITKDLVVMCIPAAW
jgi:hypothetical protein